MAAIYQYNMSNIPELMPEIINYGLGNLCFINYTAIRHIRKEWRLVKVELNESLKLNSQSLGNAW